MASLTSKPACRNKYIHGFTPIAGNFPRQGLPYAVLFTGLNVEDFGYSDNEGREQCAHVLDRPVDLHERGWSQGFR
jgi:hypothetical protein